MSKVWPLQMGHADKLVLLALADNANDDGHCWPTIGNLITKTCLCARAVQQSIGRLAKAGHVTVERRPLKSNIYLVHPAPDAGGASHAGGASDARGARDEGAPDAGGASGSKIPGSSPSFSPLTLPPLTPPPPREPSKGSRIDLHESIPRDAWEEWLAHRREKRWSMSPRALKPQLKLLAKYDTETQREILETSMQAGWQGLFAPKGKKANSQGQVWQ
jgi:hypothetical protein